MDEFTLAAKIATQTCVNLACLEVLETLLPEATKRPSARTAAILRALALSGTPNGIAVAVEDPGDVLLVDRLRMTFGARVVPPLALELPFAEALARTYSIWEPERLARARRKIEERRRLLALGENGFDGSDRGTAPIRAKSIELLRPIGWASALLSRSTRR